MSDQGAAQPLSCVNKPLAKTYCLCFLDILRNAEFPPSETAAFAFKSCIISYCFGASACRNYPGETGSSVFSEPGDDPLRLPITPIWGKKTVFALNREKGQVKEREEAGDGAAHLSEETGCLSCLPELRFALFVPLRWGNTWSSVWKRGLEASEEYRASIASCLWLLLISLHKGLSSPIAHGNNQI